LLIEKSADICALTYLTDYSNSVPFKVPPWGMGEGKKQSISLLESSHSVLFCPNILTIGSWHSYPSQREGIEIAKLQNPHKFNTGPFQMSQFKVKDSEYWIFSSLHGSKAKMTFSDGLPKVWQILMIFSLNKWVLDWEVSKWNFRKPLRAQNESV
jgi:hypothetical protein